MKNTEEIKIITGVRRCGKTTFLKQFINELLNEGIPKENIIYISFELSKYKTMTDIELDNLIFKKTKDLHGKIYLLFDEIQNVKNWEKSVNSYRVELNCDIYLTGSNSQLFSGEFATLLSGRYIKMDMYPFSYKEILQYYTEEKKRKLNSTEEQEILEEYIIYGGFPGHLKYDDEEKLDYLKDIFATIVLYDIINKNKIKDEDLFERLIQFMINNIGNTFSANSISKYLKNEGIIISPKTIMNFLNYAKKAYLLYRVKREDLIGKKLLTVNEKYYLADLGFYTLFFDESERDLGQIIENIVYLELMRRKYKVTIAKVHDLEVDFICKKHNQKKYIQVSQTILDPNTRERELKSLEKIKDNYPKYIISLDQYNLSHNGIKHLKLIDFLKDTEF